MKALLQLLGLFFMLLGLYWLGQNLLLSTRFSPYWWRGLWAGLSVLLLTIGLLKLLLLPIKRIGYLGWFPLIGGLLCLWFSDRAIFMPPMLTPFALSLVAFILGYRLFAIGKLGF